MNLKVNPCEDFYQYSCGGWLDKTSIPDSKAKYNIFSELGTKNDLVIKMEMEKIINGKVNVSVRSILIFILFFLCIFLSCNQIESKLLKSLNLLQIEDLTTSAYLGSNCFHLND